MEKKSTGKVLFVGDFHLQHPPEPFPWSSEVVDNRSFGFAEACVASGIDPTQLRNGLDRATFSVGEKLRVGRWAFSLRDCFQLVLIRQLSFRAWVPPSVAAQIASKLARQLEEVMLEAETLSSDKRADVQTHFVMFGSIDGPKVYIHKRRDDDKGGYYLPTGEAAEFESWREAHVRISAVGALVELMRGLALSQGSQEPSRSEDK